MIRKALPSDIGGMTDIAEKMAKRYPSLVFSRKKVSETLTYAVSCASDFVWVSQTGHCVDGCLVAMVSESLWSERKTASILLFFTDKPGRGESLMREFLRWADARRAIKHIEMGVDLDADRRIELLLGRMGFETTDIVFRKIR